MVRGPNFIRLREGGSSNKIVQEIIEENKIYFLGKIKRQKNQGIVEVDHIGVRPKTKGGMRILLLHYCAVTNPEKLTNDKQYQETGRYRAKNSSWTYIRKPANSSGQPLANACCFTNIVLENPAGCQWDIEWLSICIDCKNQIQSLKDNLCPRCRAKRTMKATTIWA